MRFNELDVVKTRIDFSEHGINKGDIGVIIFAFDSPDEAYEVEFDDGEGKPKAAFQCSHTLHQVRPCKCCSWFRRH